MSWLKKVERALRQTSAEVDHVGFVGTDEVARIVDWRKTPGNVQARLYHVHDISGECMKHRGGTRCNEVV